MNEYVNEQQEIIHINELFWKNKLRFLDLIENSHISKQYNYKSQIRNSQVEIHNYNYY